MTALDTVPQSFSVFDVPAVPKVQLTAAPGSHNCQGGYSDEADNGDYTKKIQSTQDYEEEDVENERIEYEEETEEQVRNATKKTTKTRKTMTSSFLEIMKYLRANCLHSFLTIIFLPVIVLSTLLKLNFRRYIWF